MKNHRTGQSPLKSTLLAQLCAKFRLREPRIFIAILLSMLGMGNIPSAHALPAFARKYGLRCSACHESWPMLNYFGQKFKDNGYQLMNDRDAPIWQNPSYWPITLRITPFWHRESTNKIAVDSPTGVPNAASIRGLTYSG